MKKIINYMLILTTGVFMSGCFGDQPNLKEKDLTYDKPKVDYKDFEIEVVKLATKAERNWEEYTQLLTQRKELKDVDLNKHIPVGMGSISSLSFQGYLGNFLKLIGEKAGYVVEFENMSVIDTPVITIDSHKTVLYEILRSTIEKYDYDLKILESERRLVFSVKI